MIKPPQNLTALDGKDATISCNAQGAPAPNITWFVNGKIVFQYSYLNLFWLQEFVGLVGVYIYIYIFTSYIINQTYMSLLVSLSFYAHT